MLSDNTPSAAALAEYMGNGRTAKSISHRLQKLKQNAKDDKEARDNGGPSGEGQDEDANDDELEATAAVTTPKADEKKTAGTGKAKVKTTTTPKKGGAAKAVVNGQEVEEGDEVEAESAATTPEAEKKTKGKGRAKPPTTTKGQAVIGSGEAGAEADGDQAGKPIQKRKRATPAAKKNGMANGKGGKKSAAVIIETEIKEEDADADDDDGAVVGKVDQVDDDNDEDELATMESVKKVKVEA